MASGNNTTPAAPLTRDEIVAFAMDWYRKLDLHVDVGELTPMLASSGLQFMLPEGPLTTHEEFSAWYIGGPYGSGTLPGVVNIFFDEVHTVRSVEVGGPPERPLVKVVVNWQARRWNPPAPRSQWIGFDAYQTWDMVRDPASGRPVIARYVVDGLPAMPGSPPL